MAPTTPGNRSTTTPVATQPAAPRRGRPPKPSAKVLDNRRSLRLYAAATGTASDEDPEELPGPIPNERDAKLDLLTQLITALNETISQQSLVIQDVRAELIHIKAEQQELKTQNTELQEEIRTLQGKFDTASASLPSTRSWASIAAAQKTTESGANLSRTASNESANREPNCLRISTHPPSADGDPASESFTRYLPTQVANRHIRDALQRSEPTKSVQVAGVGTTKTGYVIRFKDATSKETAKENAEWLEELGNGTKLVKPRFGVVVHRMPTEALTLPERKKEAIERIMEENEMAANGYRVDDIAWLRNKDKPLGTSASLGVWFDTPEAAEWTINNGLVCGQRYIGSVEAYQVKKKRCHRCQGFGHLAWSCKEAMKCRHCSGDHDRRDCPPGNDAKCVDCSGPHPTGDKGCRVLAITNSQQ